MQQVETVQGPIDIDNLGITLMHEHLLLDRRHVWEKPRDTSAAFADAEVSMNILTELKHNPYGNYDNNFMLDIPAACEEVMVFKEAGGTSIVEVTPEGLGREPEGLKEISINTGTSVIMGCGYYLEKLHPAYMKDYSKEKIADKICSDLLEGVGPDKIKAGIIGEIGISPDMTKAEVNVLKGAVLAQKQTGKILTIHLPGWERYAHQVLDIVEKQGGYPEMVVLNHMNPSMYDLKYQLSLADRGAFLEYDMIGIDLLFPEGQSPTDDENAKAVVQLLEKGYRSSLLLSQDVFLKNLMKAYGGGGYAHILTNFIPRLKSYGVTEEDISAILETNPKEVFRRAKG